MKHTGSGKTIIGELNGKLIDRAREIKEILDGSKRRLRRG